MTTTLTTYSIGLKPSSILATDDEDGRMVASEVLGGPYADANYADPSGLGVNLKTLTPAQRHHLKRHGWCPILRGRLRTNQ